MRLLQIAVPVGKRDAVEAVLRERDVDYFLLDETSQRDYGVLVVVPVETAVVEPLVDELREAGVQREGYVMVGELEAIVSDRFEDRQSEESETDEDAEETSGRISRDELRARAADIAPITPNYVVFTVVSTVIATAGLLMDSAAIVVGSMVIAPLIGPPIAASVGTILDDDDLFVTSVKAQFFGLAVAVASAALFAGFVRLTFLPNADIQVVAQIAERINPGALALVVALGAGVAGAVSLTSSTSIALVGVAIAVALIPPAATVGLGIAYGDVTATVSAAVLVSINVLSINATSLATLWLQGYRPDHWFAERSARRAVIRRTAGLVLIVLALSSALVVTTINVSENAEFERTVEDVAAESDGRILSIDTAYRTDLLVRHPTTVTVRLVGSTATAEQLRERIAAETDRDVTVIVIRERGEVSESGQRLDAPAATAGSTAAAALARPPGSDRDLRTRSSVAGPTGTGTVSGGGTFADENRLYRALTSQFMERNRRPS